MTDEENLAKTMIENAEAHLLPRLDRLVAHLEAEGHPTAADARDICRKLKGHIHAALNDLTEKE
jgi:hypothetical protein